MRIPEKLGTWQSHIIAESSDLERIPNSLDTEQTAQAFINPTTAYRLLNDFVELKEGDWIIQNAANSAVGQCVIQLARARGIKTINIVRNSEKWETHLKDMGATLVLSEDSDYHKNII